MKIVRTIFFRVAPLTPRGVGSTLGACRKFSNELRVPRHHIAPTDAAAAITDSVQALATLATQWPRQEQQSPSAERAAA